MYSCAESTAPNKAIILYHFQHFMSISFSIIKAPMQSAHYIGTFSLSVVLSSYYFNGCIRHGRLHSFDKVLRIPLASWHLSRIIHYGYYPRKGCTAFLAKVGFTVVQQIRNYHYVCILGCNT